MNNPNINEFGLVVVRRENEDIESLLKRFKKKVTKNGIFRELKLKSFYEKPSVLKKRKKIEAMARLRKEQLKLEKIKRRYKKNEDDSSKK
jgi:small subunit ribosomal protein S21